LERIHSLVESPHASQNTVVLVSLVQAEPRPGTCAGASRRRLAAAGGQLAFRQQRILGREGEHGAITRERSRVACMIEGFDAGLSFLNCDKAYIPQVACSSRGAPLHPLIDGSDRAVRSINSQFRLYGGKRNGET
jgi:hypothetical protein